jgi:hypothetical protein
MIAEFRSATACLASFTQLRILVPPATPCASVPGRSSDDFELKPLAEHIHSTPPQNVHPGIAGTNASSLFHRIMAGNCC